MTKDSRSGPEVPSRRVAILLCTYNGARYLGEQLDSFERQTHRDWVIYASDDGSTDETLDLLRRYQARLGEDRLVMLNGPRKGFAWNFLSLVRNPSIEADFFAFSDQDDIWHDDKLARGLDRLKRIPAGTPALFCARTRLVDEAGQVLGYSPLFSKLPSFRNALVQSLAGANTMLLNAAARQLLIGVPEGARVVSHDWLTYILVTGCGGEVFYDAQPTLDYRQHGGNIIGSNASLTDRFKRIRKMMSGTFRDWNRDNLKAIRQAQPLFTPENRQVLRQFMMARKSSALARVRLLRKAGLYRQTMSGNIGLLLAAGMGKI
ncbi:glycosyltransferase family 2 protein [Stutzerimonas tarimensis]|uniref:Glycosyltransferase family 2 protein n=1 Tax=Stutzerimonas tarimensis TaxID=1507735 RepID=A0ABV7T9X3_9GAMM